MRGVVEPHYEQLRRELVSGPQSDEDWENVKLSAALLRQASGLLVTAAPSEDDAWRAGRIRFYQTRDASAHGDLSCATCHLFAGSDNLAWDLGDPQGPLIPIPPGETRGDPEIERKA